ncbi:hypothetical protein PN478_13355 [Dolichospermum circinale CS-534/05]|uniref:hypothetical protein n=1 Tax=Dolichospermum circinale TaxID=109265 RepID=UPI00232F906F|nr:hypothetical protein [Dolichospermum circinale]MDB9453893.1 hypothetical protein [Dolichospermum circinale CS-541/06]MDB9464794.1 hypothetical protein [Dolichospermum circinale CS-541/04]MDB9491503.1 hypothetical protein [Dolichospermum circinale CS-534/05]MDB9548502.1 hypothetical protein [Dolichospermum circinale CS-1031]
MSPSSGSNPFRISNLTELAFFSRTLNAIGGSRRRIFGIEVPSDILAQYLGDIKNYQEQKREGAGYLIDIGQPQRVSVRRRMITGLVKMGLANYDRWYVLSHSLGTVVAFNGLMESDAALPNYLNQDLWEEVRNDGMRTTTDQENSLSQKQADNMFPSRPAWLELNNTALPGVMRYSNNN